MTDISFFDGLSGASDAPTAVKFNGTDITEIKIREGAAGAFTTAWTSVPPAPTPSTSYNYLSDATDGSGNPQPHLIPDFSTPTATLTVPSQYASDVYAGDYKKQFGCGGTAIDGDVCAVIGKSSATSYHGGNNGTVFIYERSGGSWSYSASFGGVHTEAGVAISNTQPFGTYNTPEHMGGYESSCGSAIAVHNGRVFVTAGAYAKSVYIFSKDSGTWGMEARVVTNNSSAFVDTSNNYSDDVSLSVHGGIIAMGLPHARGDKAHTGTSNHSGIVAVYVAPSKDEWVTGARGQTVAWTYWMSPGAYAEDDNDSYDHMNMGFSVAAHDGRASGGQSVIVAGVAKTVSVKNSHYYWLGDSSASFNSSLGIVDPSGVVSVPTNNSSWTDSYMAETQASLCGWGNDITFLASTGADTAYAAAERLYQLDPTGGSWDFSFMQYINAYWGGINENMDEDDPCRRGYATILADRLIVAGGRYDFHPVREVFMREQTGAGGASQSIVQGDYFIDGFNGGLPNLTAAGGSLDGGGVTFPDSQNADFEGYINFHGDLSSYWTANQSSLESTYGNKRGWGESHWYTAGIKEGREMKYQFTTYNFDDGVKIYEG